MIGHFKTRLIFLCELEDDADAVADGLLVVEVAEVADVDDGAAVPLLLLLFFLSTLRLV